MLILYLGLTVHPGLFLDIDVGLRVIFYTSLKIYQPLKNIGEFKMEIKEGIIPKITNEFYQSIPALSASSISLLLLNAKKYWYKYKSGQYHDEEEKKSTTLGSALHTLVLEPDEFFKRYSIYPDGIDRRTKEGKSLYESFLLLSNGKTILKQKDFDEVQGMANSMKSHPLFETIFLKMPGTKIENSLIWKNENDVWLKSRPDFYNKELVVDLKTTSAKSEEEFFRSIADYGYHRQAAMQLDGLSYLTNNQYQDHILFVVEKSPPYLCAMYQLDEKSIQKGREEYKQAANVYEEYVKNNYWPGYETNIIETSLPEWYFKKNKFKLLTM